MISFYFTDIYVEYYFCSATYTEIIYLSNTSTINFVNKHIAC